MLSGHLVAFSEWLPETTAEAIRATFAANLRPGTVYVLHDGPMDSPTGANVVEALPRLIDDARARGFCFGVIDAQHEVVAARYVPTAARIPKILNPVPYLPLSSDLPAPPKPFVFVNHPF